MWEPLKILFVGCIASLRSARAVGKSAHVPERMFCKSFEGRLYLRARRLTLHSQKALFRGSHA